MYDGTRPVQFHRLVELSAAQQRPAMRPRSHEEPEALAAMTNDSSPNEIQLLLAVVTSPLPHGRSLALSIPAVAEGSGREARRH
jgi:hypothetical protein